MTYTAWRKIVRLIFNLPGMTHNYIIYNLVDNIVTKLDRRLAKFIHSVYNSKNCFVNSIANHQLLSSGSIIAENRRYLEYKYHIYQVDWMDQIESVICKIIPPVLTDEKKLTIISVIRELVSMRDSAMYNMLNVDQISALLNSLCVH